MTTIELNAMKVELMSIITQTEDYGLLDKIKRLIIHENKKKTEEDTTDEPCLTKEEVLQGFDRACKELKLNMDGKQEFKTLEEVLHEL